ncbi:hypothetical protein GTQ99_11130, partial [Kineococcus sp. T13]
TPVTTPACTTPATAAPLAPRRRPRRLLAAGALAAGVSLAGAGVAAAAAPSATGRAVLEITRAVGVDWTAMPEGYDRAQYEAFWGAGYTYDDVLVLNELWGTGDTETKARAGQLVLDGQSLPLAPSGTPATS